jgi:hypothetical protein
MFCSTRTSTLAQRALGALRLSRSFLLLEDDYDVDWEVDRDEPTDYAHDRHVRPRTLVASMVAAHPHRKPLRRAGEERRRRRAGSVAGADHVCLCASPDRDPSVDRDPVAARPERRRRMERGDRASLGWRG